MPELNFILNTIQRIKLYENEAKTYEKWAAEAKDDNSRRAFLDKANERWAMAVELREGA